MHNMPSGESYQLGIRPFLGHPFKLRLIRHPTVLTSNQEGGAMTAQPVVPMISVEFSL